MNAHPVSGVIAVSSFYKLDGVGIVEIDYDGTHAGYLAAPPALSFAGQFYGRSSHNSDTRRVCYRTDKQFAIVAARP